MIAGVTPYSKYKESGQGWLGKVPRHWEVRPAFGAFVPNHERNRGMIEKTVLSLSYGRIVIKPLEKLHGLVPESFETYQVVNPGYIVLRTTDLQNDHTSLRVGMVKNRGIITSAYLALRVMDGVIPEFGYQFLNVWDMSKAIYGYGSGLRQNLDFSHFKRMLVAIPSIEEQTAIVKFLDSANGRFERTVRAKRKTISLLNEQRQAVIHHAVTRGLNPSVSLKPSGMPWVGDIPNHWAVSSVKRHFHIQLGKMLQPAPYSTDDVLVHYLKAKHVQWGAVLTQDLPEMWASPKEIKQYGVIPGDLLVCEGGEGGRCSVLTSINPPTIIQNALHRVRPRAGSCTDFLCYVMSCIASTGWFDAINNKATIAHFTSEKFGSLPIPVPPLKEQETICNFLKSELAPFTTTAERLENEITLLKEYRTRLTADVVTGKLDVCEVAKQLPKEIPVRETAAAFDASEEETEPEESAL